MSTGQAPRRRKQSAAVYRRRRLVLLIIVLLIGAGIWAAVAQPWRGWAAEPGAAPDAKPPHSTTQTSPDPSASPATADESAEPDPSATDTADAPDASAAPEVAGCRPRDVKVEPLTDQDSYGSGQLPQLSIRLTNVSDSDCTLNVGTSTQVFTVTSGTDVWWRSTDCQSEPSDMVVTLAAGQTVTSATPLTWDRTRSSVGTCDSDSRQRASGGGASYHVSVSIGGIESAQTKLILLY